MKEIRAEVLGVLKNTSPGRDMVRCRLPGFYLDKTGVLAGMSSSGSTDFVANKLLGAVACAWACGKWPIAGVTPFSQMHSFVKASERRYGAENGKPTRASVGQSSGLKLRFDWAPSGKTGLDNTPPRQLMLLKKRRIGEVDRLKQGRRVILDTSGP